MILPQDDNTVIVISDEFLAVNVNVRDGSAVFVNHQLTVLHAEVLPVQPNDGEEVPDYQQSVLTSNYQLPGVNRGTQNLTVGVLTWTDTR